MVLLDCLELGGTWHRCEKLPFFSIETSFSQRNMYLFFIHSFLLKSLSMNFNYLCKTLFFSPNVIGRVTAASSDFSPAAATTTTSAAATTAAAVKNEILSSLLSNNSNIRQYMIGQRLSGKDRCLARQASIQTADQAKSFTAARRKSPLNSEFSWIYGIWERRKSHRRKDITVGWR